MEPFATCTKSIAISFPCLPGQWFPTPEGLSTPVKSMCQSSAAVRLYIPETGSSGMKTEWLSFLRSVWRW